MRDGAEDDEMETRGCTTGECMGRMRDNQSATVFFCARDMSDLEDIAL